MGKKRELEKLILPQVHSRKRDFFNSDSTLWKIVSSLKWFGYKSIVIVFSFNGSPELFLKTITHTFYVYTCCDLFWEPKGKIVWILSSILILYIVNDCLHSKYNEYTKVIHNNRFREKTLFYGEFEKQGLYRWCFTEPKVILFLSSVVK